ncbi:MAG: hypothetical protein GC172_06495 [Phycisphaera sp.]|nr:hypothetical protein [Phycisphaera sp.]
MSHEFVHTSVERGVRGQSGFALAVVTRGLPPSLEPVLAELSGYDFDRTRAVGADRIDWAHRIVSVQGRSHTVLSRTAPCGNDWSGRPNRVAHHLVLEPHERAEAGPAWMLSAFGAFCEGVPSVEERAQGPLLPRGSCGPRPASAWEDAGFDAGWAGVVAQALLDAPSASVCVVLPEETDLLPLVVDLFALLPAEKRWLVTFSTRFQRLPAGTRCQLRFVCAGAAGVRATLAEPGVRVIEVVRGVSAGDAPAARAAREGATVEAAVREPPSLRVNPVLHKAPVEEAEPPRAVRHAPNGDGFSAASHAGMADAEVGFAAAVAERRAQANAPSELGLGAGWPAARRHRVGRARLVVALLFAYSAAALVVALVLALVLLLA